MSFVDKIYNVLESYIHNTLSINIHEELSNLKDLIHTKYLETKPKGEKKQEGTYDDEEDELEIEFTQDLSQ